MKPVCTKCGYDLRGIMPARANRAEWLAGRPTLVVCPECGLLQIPTEPGGRRRWFHDWSGHRTLLVMFVIVGGFTWQAWAALALAVIDMIPSGAWPMLFAVGGLPAVAVLWVVCVSLYWKMRGY